MFGLNNQKEVNTNLEEVAANESKAEFVIKHFYEEIAKKERIERVVKRIKATIKVDNILEQADVTTWVPIYDQLINNILVLDVNEFDVYNEEFRLQLFETLRNDVQIPKKYYHRMVCLVQRRRYTLEGCCSD